LDLSHTSPSWLLVTLFSHSFAIVLAVVLDLLGLSCARVGISAIPEHARHGNGNAIAQQVEGLFLRSGYSLTNSNCFLLALQIPTSGDQKGDQKGEGYFLDEFCILTMPRQEGCMPMPDFTVGCGGSVGFRSFRVEFGKLVIGSTSTSAWND
jgi:hypothetical protein